MLETAGRCSDEQAVKTLLPKSGLARALRIIEWIKVKRGV